MDVDVYPSVLIGYRAWGINQQTLVPLVASAYHDTVFNWQPGINKACCLQGVAHDAPARHCECGLYAYHDAKICSEGEDDGIPVIYGAIVACGDTEIHSMGFRAAEAQIIGLLETKNIAWQRQQELARRYKVPLFANAEQLVEYAETIGKPAPLPSRPSFPDYELESIDMELAHQKLLDPTEIDPLIIWHLLHRKGLNQQTVEHFQLGVWSHNFPFSGQRVLVAPYYIREADLPLVCSSLFSGAGCNRCGYIFSSLQMHEQFQKEKQAGDQTPMKIMREWAYCPDCKAPPNKAQFDWVDTRVIHEHIFAAGEDIVAEPYHLNAAAKVLPEQQQLVVTDSITATWELWTRGYEAVVALNRYSNVEQQFAELNDLARSNNKALVYATTSQTEDDILNCLQQHDLTIVSADYLIGS